MAVAVDSEIIANGSEDGFLQGKHFNRCKRLHPLMALGLEMLYFELFLEKTGLTITDILDDEIPSIDILENEEIFTILITYIAHKEKCKGFLGKTAQFFKIYIDLVNYYQLLSLSIRREVFLYSNTFCRKLLICFL